MERTENKVPRENKVLKVNKALRDPPERPATTDK